MKVVMGPANYAGQAQQLASALRAQNVDARLLRMQMANRAPTYAYPSDEVVSLDRVNRISGQFETVRRCLDEGVDIFHFWQRSFVYGQGYDIPTGVDLPLYRLHGRNVVYRFTGFDLRSKTEHMKRNKYNAFRYGYELDIDESKQKDYLAMVRETADALVVQDPEMAEFCPEATVIPRGLDLQEFQYVGVEPTDRPLVVHAPSSQLIKGTPIVRRAIEALQHEQIGFDYREITGLTNAEAVEVYRRADIVIDQMHVGWYGVLAVEAMALGKPVICYVRDDLAPSDLPVIRANPDTLIDVLRDTIKDSQRRIEAGRRGRAYAEKEHDIAKSAEATLNLYRSLPKRQASVQGYATLEHFRTQSEAAFHELRTLRSRAQNAAAKSSQAQPGAKGQKPKPVGRRQRIRAIKRRILDLSPDWAVSLWRRLRRRGG